VGDVESVRHFECNVFVIRSLALHEDLCNYKNIIVMSENIWELLFWPLSPVLGACACDSDVLKSPRETLPSLGSRYKTKTRGVLGASQLVGLFRQCTE